MSRSRWSMSCSATCRDVILAAISIAILTATEVVASGLVMPRTRHEPSGAPGANGGVRFSGCGRVIAERGYCMTTWDGDVHLVGLESGSTCAVARSEALEGMYDLHSIAWRGDALYICGRAGLTRISLPDGDFEESEVSCDGVAAVSSEGLVVLPYRGDPTYWSTGLPLFPSFESLLRDPDDATYLPTTRNSRIAVHGRLLFSAWHSTDSVEVQDLFTGETLPSIPLEGYDDWIWGFSVTGDGELIVSGPPTETPSLFVFDVRTGDRLRQIAMDRPAVGLVCLGRRDHAAKRSVTTLPQLR